MTRKEMKEQLNNNSYKKSIFKKILTGSYFLIIGALVLMTLVFVSTSVKNNKNNPANAVESSKITKESSSTKQSNSIKDDDGVTLSKGSQVPERNTDGSSNKYNHADVNSASRF